jgi:CBS domain-containing protein
MKASDVMTPKVISVPPETRVPEIAALLLERRISAVAVVEHTGNVAGVVSEGDLIRRPELGTDRSGPRWLRLLVSPEADTLDFIKTHGLCARDVMTSPAVSVSPDAPLAEIVRMMGRRGIKRVLVVDGNRLAGIVTRTDLLRALHARDALPSQGVPVDDGALRQKILDTLANQDWSYSAVFNVQVLDGHVELWGAVNSEEQSRAIHLAVEGVPGVRGITEHFGRVRPGYA